MGGLAEALEDPGRPSQGPGKPSRGPRGLAGALGGLARALAGLDEALEGLAWTLGVLAGALGGMAGALGGLDEAVGGMDEALGGLAWAQKAWLRLWEARLGGGDGRTDKQSEFLPILQDFVHYRGRCPKRKKYYYFLVNGVRWTSLFLGGFLDATTRLCRWMCPPVHQSVPHQFVKSS